MYFELEKSEKVAFELNRGRQVSPPPVERAMERGGGFEMGVVIIAIECLEYDSGVGSLGLHIRIWIDWDCKATAVFFTCKSTSTTANRVWHSLVLPLCPSYYTRFFRILLNETLCRLWIPSGYPSIPNGGRNKQGHRGSMHMELRSPNSWCRQVPGYLIPITNQKKIQSLGGINAPFSDYLPTYFSFPLFPSAPQLPHMSLGRSINPSIVVSTNPLNAIIVNIPKLNTFQPLFTKSSNFSSSLPNPIRITFWLLSAQ